MSEANTTKAYDKGYLSGSDAQSECAQEFFIQPLKDQVASLQAELEQYRPTPVTPETMPSDGGMLLCLSPPNHIRASPD